MQVAELLLAGGRGLHLAALSGVLGAFLVARLAGPSALADLCRRSIAALLGAAVLAGLLWFTLQAAAMGSLGFPQAQWRMLTGSGFGRWMALRLLLLGLALLLYRGGPLPRALAAACVLGAVAVQPLLGHGAAQAAPVAWSGTLHVLAGGLWAGSLFWLWTGLRKDPAGAVTAARRFSPVGILLVLALGAGVYGQWSLVGGLPGLLGTPYGNLLLVKAALLLVMLACAGLNGLWLAPEQRIKGLQRSITLEAAAGLAVVFTAAALALLPPGAHDRVLWPFDFQPLPGLWSDAFLRDRLLRMALPLAGALGLVLAGLILLRHARWLSLLAAVLAGVVLWHMPVFPAAPFLRPALPTSFQTAEVRRSTVSTLLGRDLYLANCTACHGETLRGAGPLATGDPVFPPDLGASWFTRTRDGDWFWRIRHGMQTEDGRPSMPGFAGLDDAQIWQLVDFLRAGASARSLDSKGKWGLPPRMPALRLACRPDTGLGTLDLSRPPGGVPVYLGPRQEATGVLQLPPGTCDPLPPDAIATLELLAGRALAADTALLIDGEGHLRQLWDVAPDPAALAAAVDEARRVPASLSGGHH